MSGLATGLTARPSSATDDTYGPQLQINSAGNRRDGFTRKKSETIKFFLEIFQCDVVICHNCGNGSQFHGEFKVSPRNKVTP
jgi:hypothetical protein